ncbi:MAG: leucine-rich repeat domain-containing protein [Candidatus Lokiarchaeota archaeon]|nr:leucine-rich repeat domain-containing protein [Candidatus Lokiarchaeota archaeon]
MGTDWDYYFAIPLKKLDELKRKALETWFDIHNVIQDKLLLPNAVCLSFWHVEEGEIAPVDDMNKHYLMKDTFNQILALKKDLELQNEPLFYVGIEGELDPQIIVTLGLLYPLKKGIKKQILLNAIESIPISKKQLPTSPLKGEQVGLEINLTPLMLIGTIGLYWGHLEPLYEHVEIKEGNYIGAFYVTSTGILAEDFVQKLDEIWALIEEVIGKIGENWSKRKIIPVRWLSSKFNGMLPYHGPLLLNIRKNVNGLRQLDLEKELPLYEGDRSTINEIEQSLGIILQRQTTPPHKNWNYGYMIEGDRVIGLGLNHCGLTELPKAIQHLSALEILDLSWNEIAEIPTWISKLRSLKTIYLVKNRLKSLPKDFNLLVNLETLWLQSNQIKKIPSSILQLPSLKTLSLSNNLLISLPETLQGLVSLETLDLWKNRIQKIPPILGNLKKLRILKLNDNPINILPDSLENLSNLEELDIFGCHIKQNPLWISKLPKLKKFRR